MINKELLKEIIVSNEEFILNQVKVIIKGEGIIFPDFPDSLDVPENKRLNLRKVVILYGVRRSVKTYILYDLFKKYKDRALYIDLKI